METGAAEEPVVGNEWLDPGFMDADRCDFRLRPDGAATARGAARPDAPLPARGRAGGGDGGGCGRATAAPLAEPIPLEPRGMAAEEQAAGLP